MARPRAQLTADQQATLERMALAGRTSAEIHAAIHEAVSVATVRRRVRKLVGSKRVPQRSTAVKTPGAVKTDASHEATSAAADADSEASDAAGVLGALAVDLGVAAREAKDGGNYAAFASLTRTQVQAATAAERFRARDEPEGVYVDMADMEAAARSCRERLHDLVARRLESAAARETEVSP